ncbi:MAG: DUF5995 family protein, partial [Ilumatobacteraceae bacterium]
MTRSFPDTVTALEALVARCAAESDRRGYFAAMYLAVTRTVRDRVELGTFTDDIGMRGFVAAFAGRYLDADEAWRARRPVSAAWRAAFEAATERRPVILQHLLLGMNAHINLDLGVTTSELAVDGSLDAVRHDFDAVNDVLGALIDGCEEALGQVSPWIGLADRVGGGGDETLIRFSLVKARQQAWATAVRLVGMEGAARDRAIDSVDATAARIARYVAHPGPA